MVAHSLFATLAHRSWRLCIGAVCQRFEFFASPIVVMTRVTTGHTEPQGTMDAASDAPAPVRFFTIADAGYFPGLVGLVNSLRLQGHGEPITVLDLGLLAEQRAALQTECEFVVPPSEILDTRGLWSRTRASFETSKLSCMSILTSSSAGRSTGSSPLHRRDGSACLRMRRRLAGSRSGNRSSVSVAAPRKQTYINAGFLAFSTACFPQLLSRWSECCGQLVSPPTHLDPNDLDSPTALSSQDALNAVLMSELELDQIDFQPLTAEAQGQMQLHRTRVVDLGRLACRLDGQPTTLLHAWGSPKPWEYAAAKELRRSAYLRCLRRLLVSRDVAVKIPSDCVPMWLQPGLRGALSLWLLTQARRPLRGATRRTRQAARRLSGTRRLEQTASATQV